MSGASRRQARRAGHTLNCWARMDQLDAVGRRIDARGGRATEADVRRVAHLVGCPYAEAEWLLDHHDTQVTLSSFAFFVGMARSWGTRKLESLYGPPERYDDRVIWHTPSGARELGLYEQLTIITDDYGRMLVRVDRLAGRYLRRQSRRLSDEIARELHINLDQCSAALDRYRTETSGKGDPDGFGAWVWATYDIVSPPPTSRQPQPATAAVNAPGGAA